MKSGGFYGASFSKFIIMTEAWKDIKGYEGYYQVSNLGRVKSIDKLRFNSDVIIKGKILKPWDNSHGYLQVKFVKNRVKKMPKVHRLVAQTFLGLDPNRVFVNHKDGNRSNNNIDNLEWVTRRENNCHKYINNDLPIGVSYHKQNRKYVAKISINRIQKYIGSYHTIEEAHHARVNYELNNNIINKYNGKNEISIRRIVGN